MKNSKAPLISALRTLFLGVLTVLVAASAGVISPPHHFSHLPSSDLPSSDISSDISSSDLSSSDLSSNISSSDLSFSNNAASNFSSPNTSATTAANLPSPNSISSYRKLYQYGLLEQADSPSNAYITGRGWVAVESEVAVNDGAEKGLDATIAMIASVNRALRDKKIPMVVAMIPNKTRLYADLLMPGRKLLEPNASNYSRFLARLRGAGLQAPDLATPLLRDPERSKGEGFFYRWDSHWNQKGANRAAQLIAAFTRQSFRLNLEKANYSSDPQGKPQPVPTDILDKKLRFMGKVLDAGGRKNLGLLPTPRDLYQPLETHLEGGGAGLLDGSDPEIVLLGSSFSQEVDKHNFSGFLEQAFSSGVLNASRAGGGATKSPADYFSSGDFKKNPPKLIIWEIPEYAMRTSEAEARKLAQSLPQMIAK